MDLAERFKIVPLGYDIDINGAADNYGASINMKGFHRATFLVQYEDLGGADHIVKFYSGASVSTYSSALPFRYTRGTAAATAVTTATANQDLMIATVAVENTGLTVAHATYDNFLFAFTVDAADMDVANQEEWLSIDFNDPGAATGRAIVIAILEPRYQGSATASALA